MPLHAPSEETVLCPTPGLVRMHVVHLPRFPAYLALLIPEEEYCFYWGGSQVLGLANWADTQVRKSS